MVMSAGLPVVLKSPYVWRSPHQPGVHTATVAPPPESGYKFFIVHN